MFLVIEITVKYKNKSAMISHQNLILNDFVSINIFFNGEIALKEEKQIIKSDLGDNSLVIKFGSSIGQSPSICADKYKEFPLCSHFRFKIQDLDEIKSISCLQTKVRIWGIEITNPIKLTAPNIHKLTSAFKNNGTILKKIISDRIIFKINLNKFMKYFC